MAHGMRFGGLYPGSGDGREMVSYANLGGNSNVLAYSIGPDSITVKFSDYSRYTYTYASAGRGNVERMKSLAREGCGLNSFIMLNVKYGYSCKSR